MVAKWNVPIIAGIAKFIIHKSNEAAKIPALFVEKKPNINSDKLPRMPGSAIVIEGITSIAAYSSPIPSRLSPMVMSVAK